jgi:hypothetical protein
MCPALYVYVARVKAEAKYKAMMAQDAREAAAAADPVCN